MNTSSFINPFKQTFLTSNCLIVHPKVTTSERINLIVVCFITRLKISPKSKPSIWENPWATNHALYLSVVPSSSDFILNTHLEPTIFSIEGLRIKSYVCFLVKALISSYIASNQWWIFSVVHYVFDWLILLLVAIQVTIWDFRLG